MNLLIIGPPGAGKGTQAPIISNNYNLKHLSSGDLLRQTAKGDDALGREVRSFTDEGHLVPDELMLRLIVEKILESAKSNGALLDGFPRNIKQAEMLVQIFKKNNIPLDAVLYLNAEDELVVGRVSGRRICPNCDSVYHVSMFPPKVEGICDRCEGVELQIRTDDKLEIVRERLQVYYKLTRPIIEYFRAMDLVIDIDADQEKTEITRIILDKLSRIC
jgi:adenylate kinase